MIYIGIDPGLDGGIVIKKPEGIETVIMPTTTIKKADKDKRVISHDGLKDIFKVFKSEECFAAIEEQQAMSKGGIRQGVISMVTIGVGFGALLQVLTDFDIDFIRVNPQDWQKEFGIANGDTKAQALEVCQDLFPNLNLLGTPRSRVQHKGIVDAVLIMQYGIRKHKDEI
ncbi:hypothetical protein KAW18_02155 [candidate division WOR-3 bacterium]|nr:hypothetical protein [candidate division WOR-3 bacterium]